MTQVSGGSQGFNAVNQVRILDRRVCMVTIPNPSSIAGAWVSFENGRLPAGPFHRCVVDVMEELVKFTWMVRGRADHLSGHCSERCEIVDDVRRRVLVKVL